MNKNDLSLVKGLGPKYQAILKKYNITTIEDLINIVPTNVNFFNIVNINDYDVDQNITVFGRILSPAISRFYNKSLNSLTFSMNINDEIIKVIIFNRNFLKKNIIPGKNIQIYGKYSINKREINVIDVFFDEMVYSKINYSMKEISSSLINKFINSALLLNIDMNDIFPNYLIEKYRLLPIYQYYQSLHFAKSIDQFNSALRRLKYEEMFSYFVKIHAYSLKSMRKRIMPKGYDILKVKQLINSIDFELSPDQKLTVNEIFKDFKKQTYANRLIQGDVGSGKTIVSLIAAYASVTANQQVIILAPTEILANQHYGYFRKYLERFDVTIELLTAKVSSKKRKDILDNCANGSINILIGTHSLESNELQFKNLGLVIIDEQHRFGVEIRQSVKKGTDCDSLFFTATPIPRSLALTYFKNLDISEIKSIRSNKKPIHTKNCNYSQLKECYDKIHTELLTNHQIYVVVSLIEDDCEEPTGLYDIDKAKKLFEKEFTGYNIGTLHGKMDKSTSECSIRQFYNHEIDILISTTVIEVGVSVDTASVVVVLDAQRFGLSTLHQIRGRVGRKDEEGYCYLISNNLDIDRLRVLEESSDGFLISQKDLELRGPGGIFSNNQSGINDFKYVNIANDNKLIECANEDAYEYLISNKHLENKKYSDYYKKIMTEINNIKYLN